MANPYRGQVDISVEGADESVAVYKLHYDGNALVEIEESMGMPMNTILAKHLDLMDGFKFKRAALFHGLQRDPRGKKLTLVQCGQIVASPQGKAVHQAVIKGVFLALGFDIEKKLAEREALVAEGKDPDAEEAEAKEDPLAPEA